MVMLIVFVLLNLLLPDRDKYILPIIGLLTGWGLILLDRLAPIFLWRQVLWLIIGMMAMVAIAVLPTNFRFLNRYRYTWLLIGLALLLATLILGVNPSGQGAALWLKVPLLGQVYFQPSELLKLILIVFLASYFDERLRMLSLGKVNMRQQRLAFLAPLILMWSFCIIVLIWQRDLGAATLFFVVFLALLFLATGELRYVAGGLGLLLIAGALGYLAFDVVALRIDMWMNPWLEADSRGYQIVQSLYALAAGSVFGQGIAQGYPSYIPVVHSDFAFAAIGEEWGLIGTTTVVICFGVFVYRGLRIALLAIRPFSIFLAAGISVVFSVQALLIMGGVTKLLPLTGVTLPFVSYGGSSLIISCIMTGLLLNLSASGNRRLRIS
jgi:cell division protein FtsW (lipid II flippase)